MGLDERIDREAVAAGWLSEIRATYLSFAARLMRQGPLAVKFGAGGLSFYKETGRGHIFVCHHNATPRGGSTSTGFADFRRDALAGVIDVAEAITRLQATLGLTITLRVAKTWCSMHFPRERSDEVADALREIIIARVS